MEREYMEFDVVIVGAGPAGLSAACRLKQKAAGGAGEQQAIEGFARGGGAVHGKP